MDGDSIKRRLFELGHFHNPDKPSHGIRTAEDAEVLTLTSPEVKDAIASFQDFMRLDFDRLAKQYHDREGIADGDIGPATIDLFAVPRCGEPDYRIEGAHVEEATGAGSWPVGCFAEYPNHHAICVDVVERGMPSHVRPQWDAIWERVTEAYRDIGMVLIVPDRATRPGTRLTFESLAGSTIGLAIVPNRPNCQSFIWLKLDPGYRPSDTFNQWCRLTAHELCHNMGLSHTRGGIMNPSIVSGPFTSTAWRGDPSFPALARFFGGEPVPPRNPTPGPDPGPGPNPPPSSIVLRGEITAEVDGKPAGTFILTPKPNA